MRRFIRFIRAITASSLILGSATAIAAPRGEPELDLSILEEREDLQRYMTASQRITFLDAERALEAAQSKIRSGTYLFERPPPKVIGANSESPQETKQRGEEMIKEGKVEERAALAKLVAILEEIAVVRTERQAADATRLNAEPELVADRNAAFSAAAETLLEYCWSAGYEQILFDGVFSKSEDAGLTAAEADLRNTVYDLFVKKDGTKFTVSVPMALRLAGEEDEETIGPFTFDNVQTYLGRPTALIALELFPDDALGEILVARVIDLETERILHHAVYGITEGAPAVRLNAKINTQILGALETFDPPYQFTVDSAVEDPSETQFEAALVTRGLVRNTSIQVVDPAFLEAAYADENESRIQKGNAHFVLQEVPDAEGTLSMTANADGSDRMLPVAILQLEVPTAETATN